MTNTLTTEKENEKTIKCHPCCNICNILLLSFVAYVVIGSYVYAYVLPPFQEEYMCDYLKTICTVHCTIRTQYPARKTCYIRPEDASNPYTKINVGYAGDYYNVYARSRDLNWVPFGPELMDYSFECYKVPNNGNLFGLIALECDDKYTVNYREDILGNPSYAV